MFYVYIIRGKGNKHYIGYTDNLQRRIEEHNRGKTKSNKSFAPFELIYHENYATEIEAINRERKIKSYKGGIAFKKLINKTLSSSLV